MPALNEAESWTVQGTLAHTLFSTTGYTPPVSGQDQFIRSDRAIRTCLTAVEFLFSLPTHVANRGSAEVSRRGNAKIFKYTSDQQPLFSVRHGGENITLQTMLQPSALKGQSWMS
jgi:hypothetical protein